MKVTSSVSLFLIELVADFATPVGATEREIPQEDRHAS